MVLKDARSIVASPQGEVAFNSSGCAALATAGSGDVLAGCIAALIGKRSKEEIFKATCVGVYLHGLAGELNPSAQRSLIADELPDLLAQALKFVSPLA